MNRTVFLLLIIVVFFIVSCELFLAPKHPRDNPNDPDNPVQPVAGFSAVGLSSTEVKLTFLIPSYQDATKAPVGYIIRRGEEDPPGWIDQGELVDENAAAAFEAGKTVEIIDTGGTLESGKEYWYSIWVHGSGEYREHYTHSGQSSAIVETPPVFTSLDDPASNYAAYGIGDDGVRVEWGYGSGSFTPPSHYVVRYDGFVSPTDPTAGKGFVVDWDWGFEDWGLDAGAEYTYAIFQADEDGSPYPLADGSSPAFDTATTILRTATIQAFADAYVDNMGEYGSAVQMTVSDGDASQRKYGLINFDPSTITDFGYLSEARLMLSTTADPPAGGDIQVLRIDGGHNGGYWDEGSGLPTWLDIENGFISVDDGYSITNYVDSANTTYTWDITPLVWRMIYEGSFNGLVLRATEVTVAANFITINDTGADPVDYPQVEIDYYQD